MLDGIAAWWAAENYQFLHAGYDITDHIGGSYGDELQRKSGLREYGPHDDGDVRTSVERCDKQQRIYPN